MQTPSAVLGCDLSHYNTVDIPTLLPKYQFIILKASQGIGYVDPAYSARAPIIWASTTLLGAYHFGTNSNATLQVHRFIDTIKSINNLLPCLDLETNPDTTPQSEGTMTLVTAANWVTVFHTITDKWPMIYTNASHINFLNRSTAEDVAALAVLSQCQLWVASEHIPPLLPDNWSTWAICQYTTTDGIDQDIFNIGTYPDIRVFWAGKIWPTPLPAPPSTQKTAVTTAIVRIRQSPNTTSKILGILYSGTHVDVTGQVANEFEKLSNIEGWLHQAEIKYL